MRQALDLGDYKTAAEEFLLGNNITVNGIREVLPGLVSQRKAEKALFLS